MIINKKGLTLVEILVSVGIMAVAIGSVFHTTHKMFELNEYNQSLLPIMNAIEGKMDEIRNVPFDDISSGYDGSTFLIGELTTRSITHRGSVQVDVIEASFLLRVKITVSWQHRTKTIGEDANFNGVLDSGEDTVANGELDSPCSMITAIPFN